MVCSGASGLEGLKDDFKINLSSVTTKPSNERPKYIFTHVVKPIRMKTTF